MELIYAGPDPDLLMSVSGEDRAPGLHLSDILKRVIFERDKTFNPASPIEAMVLERGFTWEFILERALAARHQRPGARPAQIQEDGVWLSPDWVSDEGVHEEWKATKKSTRWNFLEKNWYWMPQAQAYLRALLRRNLVQDSFTRFRVWHINGNYSYRAKTSDFHLLDDYWRYDVAFTARELDENWQQLLSAGMRFGLLPQSPVGAALREDLWLNNSTRLTGPNSLTSPDGEAPEPSSRVVPFPPALKP